MVVISAANTKKPPKQDDTKTQEAVPKMGEENPPPPSKTHSRSNDCFVYILKHTWQETRVFELLLRPETN